MRVTEEIQRLVENLNSIDFMTEEQNDNDSKDVLASYKGIEKRVLINPRYYNALTEYYNSNFEPVKIFSR